MQQPSQSVLIQARNLSKSYPMGTPAQRAENNKVDFATLLDAQRQIRQARQNQSKAQLEAQMRLAEIEKLIGEDL